MKKKKKKKKETTGKKGKKERRENERENDGGTSCSAGNAACGSSSRSDCAWCGAKEGSIPGILKHRPCGRCKLASYCSESCQKRHWKEGGHKLNCVAPADRKASAALDAARIKKDKALDNGKAAVDDGNQPYDHDENENDDENDECAMCLEISLLPESSNCRVRMRTMHNALESYESSGSSRCVRCVAPICHRGRSSCSMMQCVVISSCIVATIRALLTQHGA